MLDGVLMEFRAKSGRIWMLLMAECCGFLFGTALCLIIAGMTGDDEVVNLGVLFGLLFVGFYLLIDNVSYVGKAFGYAVGLGRTRQSFIFGYYVSELAVAAVSCVLAWLYHCGETALYRAVFPEKINVPFLKHIMAPQILLPAGVIVTVLGIFFGVLLMKNGKKAFWVLWGIWMFASLGLPRIAEAGAENPDSVFGFPRRQPR